MKDKNEFLRDFLRESARQGREMLTIERYPHSEMYWSTAKSDMSAWKMRVRSALTAADVDRKICEHWENSVPENWKYDALFKERRPPDWDEFKRSVEGGVAWLDAFLKESSRPTTEPTKKEKKAAGRVFIGHGRSSVWRDLKDFLQDTLGLKWEEFNRDSAAGLATTERLSNMLDSACFAFIVLTAEDTHSDGTTHARENVIHEAGLFQGKLGFRRAIILLEDGCEEFSNIKGLTQIRFPKAEVLAKSEEIRRVLQREGIIP